MNNDIKLIAEVYDQQMNDMKAALNAPRESRDSGAVLLDDGFYFEWWKDAQGKIYGTIYDKNDDALTDTYHWSDLAKLGAREDDVRFKDLPALKMHKAEQIKSMFDGRKPKRSRGRPLESIKTKIDVGRLHDNVYEVTTDLGIFEINSDGYDLTVNHGPLFSITPTMRETMSNGTSGGRDTVIFFTMAFQEWDVSPEELREHLFNPLKEAGVRFGLVTSNYWPYVNAGRAGVKIDFQDVEKLIDIIKEAYSYFRPSYRVDPLLGL